MRNQTWLPGTCDLRGSEVKVQAARDHLPSLSLSSQSSHWVKLLEAEGLWWCLRGLLMCCQDCAAKENKRVFSNGAENCCSFIQEPALSPGRWWITTSNHSKIQFAVWGAQRGPFASEQKQLFHNIFTRTAFIQVPSGAWPADLLLTTSRRTAGVGDEWELRKGGE